MEGGEVTLRGGSVGVPAFVDESSSADFRKFSLVHKEKTSGIKNATYVLFCNTQQLEFQSTQKQQNRF